MVDMETKSPTINEHVSPFVRSYAPCVNVTVNVNFILCAYAFTLGYPSLLGASQIIALGIRPVFRKKGEYPVDSD